MHVRDYPFDNIGIEHNPGIEADELMRSWYSEERRQFLSWISRRGHPPLARAAKLVMAAKSHSEGFSETYRPADRALERLDALRLISQRSVYPHVDVPACTERGVLMCSNMQAGAPLDTRTIMLAGKSVPRPSDKNPEEKGSR